MSTVVIGGSPVGGGFKFSIAGVITTAVNIAIIYFLFNYVRSNWDKIMSGFKLPNIDFSKFKLPTVMAEETTRENYRPQSTVDVFN